jgi:hypothetical protein
VIDDILFNHIPGVSVWQNSTKMLFVVCVCGTRFFFFFLFCNFLNEDWICYEGIWGICVLIFVNQLQSVMPLTLIRKIKINLMYMLDYICISCNMVYLILWLNLVWSINMNFSELWPFRFAMVGRDECHNDSDFNRDIEKWFCIVGYLVY